MNKTLKNNLKSESFWLRSLFMVLFYIIYRIVDILVLLVAISQWLYVLLTGDANSSLSRFAGGLANYVAQIIAYLSYNSEEKPFPFSDWPAQPKLDAPAEPVAEE
jgi:ABC-type Na+ efflux pump permease subunit